MQIQHLAIFIKLAENLSFTQTALRMNISQSACSQTITSMEDELGFTLFLRTRKSVKLTPAGRAFYTDVKPIINSYYKAVNKARNTLSEDNQTLTIGYSGTPYENATLPKLIKKYSQKNPNLQIFLECHGHDDLKLRLSNGDIDLIWTMPDIVQGMQNIKFTTLNVGYYVIAVPNGYPIERKEKFNIKDLNGKKIIFIDTQWLPPISINIQKEIKRRNSNIHIEYANTIVAENSMVQAGLALGLWTNFVTNYNDKSMTTIPLETDAVPRYGVATRIQNETKTTKNFVKWLKNQEFQF